MTFTGFSTVTTETGRQRFVFPNSVIDQGGGKYVSSGVGEVLAGSVANEREPAGHKRLSEREFQVLIRIARGNKPAQIASELSLSAKTVATYRTRLLRKMEIRSTADIVAYCIRSGLIA
jgi:DNA-binding NarL/FixJ family response regulator